ncbi:MAG: hypothetical protein BWY82_01677 [Verrucomicrobia bacterium ADurb.Bin474]|nr:MAG: hypothetical protein BWY82_01677 [Verrucomicrobia bacterium ADurb.Bin474]
MNRKRAIINDGLNNRMSGFMVGYNLLVLIIHEAPTLPPIGNLFAGFIHFGCFNLVLSVTGGNQRRFVEQVRQISPGETGSVPGRDGKIHLAAQLDLLGMDLQDLIASIQVGQVDHNLTVKTAWPQQCTVQDIRAIGCSNDDHPFVSIKTVHLDQQRIQGLLALVVSSAQAGSTLTANCVNLIDENQARRILATLFEHIPNPGGAHPDKHFNKIGTRNGEKRHIRLTGHSFGQQGFSCSRRAHHQYALGYAPTNALKLLWLT